MMRIPQSKTSGRVVFIAIGVRYTPVFMEHLIRWPVAQPLIDLLSGYGNHNAAFFASCFDIAVSFGRLRQWVTSVNERS